mgnify:CR=1 FL=1
MCHQLPVEVWAETFRFMPLHEYTHLVGRSCVGVSREFYSLIKGGLTELSLRHIPTPWYAGVWLSSRPAWSSHIKRLDCLCAFLALGHSALTKKIQRVVVPSSRCVHQQHKIIHSPKVPLVPSLEGLFWLEQFLPIKWLQQIVCTPTSRHEHLVEPTLQELSRIGVQLVVRKSPVTYHYYDD